MAKADTTSITIRLPSELVKWADTQSGTRTDVVAAALTNLRDGPVIVDNADAERVAKLEQLVRDLTDKVASQEIELIGWRKLKPATMPTSNAEARRLALQHAAGPVLPPTGLPVRGEARPMFRPGTNADKATKSG